MPVETFPAKVLLKSEPDLPFRLIYICKWQDLSADGYKSFSHEIYRYNIAFIFFNANPVF